MSTVHRPFAMAWIVIAAAGNFFALTPGSSTAAGLEWSGRHPVTAELTGDKEIPPVSTKAYGKSTITVGRDRSVKGSVIVVDMTPTSAHIHQGGLDVKGPVIIPLIKTAENTFSVPPNTWLTEEQFARYKEGNLYVNVHSDRFPTGEIRAQMRP